MISNEYPENLKQLLDFTKIKYGTFADALGYDISYISKWVNGVRLPAAKNVDMINQQIADYLAKVIFRQKQANEFSKEFTVSYCDSEETFRVVIYDLLSRSYRMSIRKEKVQQTDGKTTTFISGQASCQYVMQQLFKQRLETATNPPSMVITGEYYELAENSFWQLLASIRLNVCPCSVHVILDLSNMKTDKTALAHKLYHCLDTLLDYQFTIYGNLDKAYDNIIVVENQFAVLYYLNEQHNIDMCVLITDLIQVNQIYCRCRDFIKTQPILLLPKKTLGMERFGYRDMFFTSNKYFYFLAHGFEFLLPDQVFESLVKNAKKGLYRPANEKWVHRIQVIWKNLMDKAELHFVLPSNSIIQYLETGYIHLNDFSYQLTLEERKLHIQQVLNVMKSNPNITLGVLLPTVGKYDYENFINLSFYSNYSTAFFKKSLQRINENTAPIYLVNNSDLLQCFQEFFANQVHSPGYREYTYQDLVKLCEKYNYLLANLFDDL